MLAYQQGVFFFGHLCDCQDLRPKSKTLTLHSKVFIKIKYFIHIKLSIYEVFIKKSPENLHTNLCC